MPVMADAAGGTSFLTVSALSHEGLVRDHNEDSLVVGPWTVCASVTMTPETLVFPLVSPVVVAVADGLGGHPAGEHASSLVALELARVGPELSDEARVRAALVACNETVYREAAADPSRTMMGTTVAGVCVTADSVLVFNVGDSRVYRTGARRPEPGQHRRQPTPRPRRDPHGHRHPDAGRPFREDGSPPPRPNAAAGPRKPLPGVQ